MQQRTAPPFSCYLRYFLRQPISLGDRTSATISCKRNNRHYRIVKTVGIAWMYFIIVFSGLFVSSFASFPSWILKALTVVIAFLLAWLASGLYSYCHTEFEEVSDD